MHIHVIGYLYVVSQLRLNVTYNLSFYQTPGSQLSMPEFEPIYNRIR